MQQLVTLYKNINLESNEHYYLEVSDAVSLTGHACALTERPLPQGAAHTELLSLQAAGLPSKLGHLGIERDALDERPAETCLAGHSGAG
jgi:hypothetical protein